MDVLVFAPTSNSSSDGGPTIPMAETYLPYLFQNSVTFQILKSMIIWLKIKIISGTFRNK